MEFFRPLERKWQRHCIVASELVRTVPSRRNWKGILLALLVISLICSIIITAIILVTPNVQTSPLKKPLSYREFLKLQRLVQRPTTQWVQNSLLTQDDGEWYDISRYELTPDGTLNRTRFFSQSRLQQLGITGAGYPVASADLEAVLVSITRTQGFRHSFKATYKVIQSNAAGTRAADVRPSRKIPASEAFLQCATWSPTNHSLAFVYEKNLFFTTDPFNPNKTRSLTASLPQHDSVFYGISDWLYEEEVIEKSDAFWFSPKGNHIVFLSFNDTALPRYNMTWYGSPDNLYAATKPIIYPKAGDERPAPSPIVKIFVATNVASKTDSPNEIRMPEGIPADHYVVFVRWYDDDRILVGWTDRVQIKGWISICDVLILTCRIVWEQSVPNGWIHILKETNVEPISDARNSRFFMIDTYYKDGEGNGFMQIVEVKVRNKNEIMWLTTGEFDIIDILRHVDNTLYFIAAHPNPKQRNIYKVDIRTRNIECITCKNANCTFNTASFSKNGDLFLQFCGGPGLPKTLLKKTKPGYPIAKVVADNTKALKFMENKKLARVVYKDLKIRRGTRDEMNIHAQFFYPSDLNEKQIIKYPLLLYVYAGPQVNMVKDSFSLQFHRYLSQALNIVVVSVDGRGTPNRGVKYKHAIKYRMGDIEVQDQIDSVKEICKLPFIDNTRVAAFGASYGGFTVANLLAHPDNKDLIQCGVSHAPVTNFRYYDTAYTERYLGLYKDHKDAYERTNLIARAGSIEGKRLLLTHGTGDDNVHFQNSAQLTKALIKMGVDFDVMYYPDDNHALANSRLHFQRKWAFFVRDCLNKTSHRWRLEL